MSPRNRDLPISEVLNYESSAEEFARTPIKSQRLAQAELAETDRFLAKLRYAADKFILGFDERGRPIGTHDRDDTHVLIDGGTRSDKTTALSNTLCVYPGSLWHSTTKGNEASRLAPRRGRGNEYCDGMGQIVGVADPHGITTLIDEYKVSVNVIESFLSAEDVQCVAKAWRLAVCLIPLNAGEREDGYFKNDARSLLMGLCLHVATAEQFANGRRNLMTVYELAMNGDVETWELMKAEGLLPLDKNGKPIHTPFDVLWSSMVNNSFFSGAVARRGGYYRTMIRQSAKQWTGVQAEAAMALSFMDDPGFQELFAETTFHFRDLKFNPQGASFFMCLEQSKIEACGGAVRLMYAVYEMEMKAPGQPVTGYACLTWLDEFGQMKRLDTIENGLAALAGYGVRLVICVQTLAQIKKVYGEEGVDIFLSGCLTRVFIDIRSLYDARIIKELAGEQEVIALNRSISVADGVSRAHAAGTSDQETAQWNDSTGAVQGTHESAAQNSSFSQGHTFSGGLADYILPHYLIAKLFKTFWSRNVGWSFGTALTTGANKSTNQTHSEGGSSSQGTSEVDTDTTSRTMTATLTENRQVRPLLPIDQVVNRYSKLHSDDHRLALVEICGLGFFEVHRLSYWQHEMFYRAYGKDPDHEFVQAPKPVRVIRQEQWEEAHSPAAIRRAQAEMADLKDKEDYSLLANWGFGITLVSTIVLPLVGALPVALATGAGLYGCHRWRQSIKRRELRIAQLTQLISEANSNGDN